MCCLLILCSPVRSWSVIVLHLLIFIKTLKQQCYCLCLQMLYFSVSFHFNSSKLSPKNDNSLDTKLHFNVSALWAACSFVLQVFLCSVLPTHWVCQSFTKPKAWNNSEWRDSTSKSLWDLSLELFSLVILIKDGETLGLLRLLLYVSSSEMPGFQ